LIGERRRIELAIGLLVAVALAACDGSAPASPPPSGSTARLSPASSVPGASSTRSGAPSPATPAAVADPGLLDVLPATTDVFSLTYDAETTASVAADPGLDVQVAALATGLYRLKDAPADAPDFAIVNAVRLRDPSLGPDWFQSWRETYDEAACAPAGGVVRRAETVVRGLTVFVGSCSAGAFTYHVRLVNGSTVVSMTSVGPAGIGQRVVERLHP
jgi:hypothetical protein